MCVGGGWVCECECMSVCVGGGWVCECMRVSVWVGGCVSVLCAVQ